MRNLFLTLAMLLAFATSVSAQDTNPMQTVFWSYTKTISAAAPNIVSYTGGSLFDHSAPWSNLDIPLVDGQCVRIYNTYLTAYSSGTNNPPVQISSAVASGMLMDSSQTQNTGFDHAWVLSPKGTSTATTGNGPIAFGSDLPIPFQYSPYSFGFNLPANMGHLATILRLFWNVDAVPVNGGSTPVTVFYRTEFTTGSCQAR